MQYDFTLLQLINQIHYENLMVVFDNGFQKWLPTPRTRILIHGVSIPSERQPFAVTFSRSGTRTSDGPPPRSRGCGASHERSRGSHPGPI